jgi:hypothetical protein
VSNCVVLACSSRSCCGWSWELLRLEWDGAGWRSKQQGLITTCEWSTLHHSEVTQVHEAAHVLALVVLVWVQRSDPNRALECVAKPRRVAGHVSRITARMLLGMLLL